MRIPFFTPAPGKRFSRFDLLVYRVFHKRWTQHFKDYPDLRTEFIAHMQGWDTRRASERANLTLVKQPGPKQPNV